ncbi:hypothetical protein BaRGS_00017968 [Batillaria attramentaria]|uniref:Uncharacterized protein n=1 Tax=Batillaria attramentaria TaxID=370345 RepID=A0ABD0KU67_9CAEN
MYSDTFDGGGPTLRSSQDKKDVRRHLKIGLLDKCFNVIETTSRFRRMIVEFVQQAHIAQYHSWKPSTATLSDESKRTPDSPLLNVIWG